jgi:cell division protein FtsL
MTDRPKRHAEKGAGKLKAIFWTLLLAAFIYVSVKVIPALVNEYQFQDGIQTIARFATMNRQTPDQIREAVLKEAQKDNLAIGAEDIKVEATNGNVKINADYSVVVDLAVYQWTLNFHPSVSNNALF